MSEKNKSNGKRIGSVMSFSNKQVVKILSSLIAVQQEARPISSFMQVQQVRGYHSQMSMIYPCFNTRPTNLHSKSEVRAQRSQLHI